MPTPTTQEIKAIVSANRTKTKVISLFLSPKALKTPISFRHCLTIWNKNKEVTSKTTDTAIPIGFGHIVTKIVKHQRKYKVEFFPKVTFKPFMQDAKTKGESLEFTTPSVEGTIFPLKDGTWEKHATFDNEADAITYLNSLFTGNNE